MVTGTGKSIVAALAVTLLGSSAALAEDMFIYGGLGVVHLETEGEGDGSTASGLGLEAGASGAYQFSPNFGLQGDLVFKYGDFATDEEFSLVDSRFDGALHAFYRDDAFLFGAFGQLGRSTLAIYEGMGITMDRGYAGLEGQVYFDNLTLYGQVGAQRASVVGDELTGYFGNAELRYFLNPDLKVELHGGLSSFSEDEFTMKTANIGAGVEYKLPDQPFSFFAKADYHHSSAEVDGSELDGSVGEARLLAGIKFNLGTGSLFERDRAGASLSPVNPALLADILGGGSSPPPPPPP